MAKRVDSHSGTEELRTFLNEVQHGHIMVREMARGLWENRDELVRRHIIPGISQGSLVSLTQSLFDRRANAAGTLAADEKALSQEMNRLLAASGMAVPIVLDDWDVGRTREAERTLGIRSFIGLEDTLARRYGPASASDAMIHFHKGPGNGYLMQALREERSKWAMGEPSQRTWQEIGMGDRLYFLVSDLLGQFIQPELKNDKIVQKFIQLLANALRRQLKDLWYEPSGNLWYEFKPKVGFFDLNAIFDLLSNPELLLANWYDTEGQTVTKSGEFDEDTRQKLSGPVAKLLDAFGSRSGRSLTIDEKRISMLEAEIRDYEKRLKGIADSLGDYIFLSGEGYRGYEALAPGAEAINAGYQGLVSRLRKVTRIRDLIPEVQRKPDSSTRLRMSETINSVMPGIVNTFRDFVREREEKIASLRAHWPTKVWQLRGLQRRLSSLSPLQRSQRIPYLHEELVSIMNVRIPAPADASEFERVVEVLLANEADPGREEILSESSPVSAVADFLSTMFTDEFVKGVRTRRASPVPGVVAGSPNGSPLDLNSHLPVVPTGFIPGFFADPTGRRPDIPSVVPNGTVHLMTATRSDSHENEEAFERDISGNLNALAPGGMLFTDGMRESYSRIYRLHEVLRAVSKAPGKFRCWAVLTKSGHAVKAVVVQKVHPSGFFSAEELNGEILERGSYAVPLDSVANRADIVALSSARRRILELANKDPLVFKGLQDSIHRALDRALFRNAVRRTAEMNRVSVPPPGGRMTKSVLSAVRQTYLETRYDEQTGEVVADPSSVKSWKHLRTEVLRSVRRDPRFFGAPGSVVHGDYARSISDALNARINEAVNRTGRVPVEVLPTLHGLRPDAVNLFPSIKVQDRRGLRSGTQEGSDFNAPAFLLGSKLADNDTGPDAPERLQDKIKNLQQRLSGIHRRIGPPIVLITFRDCATNEILKDTLKRLLGDRQYFTYVEHLNITFTSATTPANSIRNAQNALAKYLNRGAVIVGGGSWVNTDDPWGVEYARTIGVQLFDAAANPKSGIFQVPVCFSSQTAAQMVGERYLDGDLSVRHGPLEMGPVTVKRINDADASHPLLKDLPAEFTLAATHGGHILWSRSRDRLVLNPYWRPLLRSKLTGQDVAWEAFDGRMLPILLHPEVPLIDEKGSPSSAIQKIMMELNRPEVRRAIYGAWGVCRDDLSPIWQNWNQVRGGHVRANIGDEMLVNALIEMTNRLVEYLGPLSRRGRR